MAPRKRADQPARRAPIQWTDASGKVRRSAVPREEYARRGHIQEQQILPGMESHPAVAPPSLSRWEDMPAAKKAEVTSRQRDTYGVTMSNAIHNHGVLLDRSFIGGEGGGAGRGRHFYRGGSEASEDVVGHAATAHIAETHGIPFHVAAYMRAALSPRSNVHDEITNIGKVIDHVRSGKAPGPVEGVSGLAGAVNSTKAAAVFAAHLEGVHPRDVKMPSGKPAFGSRTTQKIDSYAQSYTHPDHPGTRTAVDTHAVGGMAPHLPKAPARQEHSGGKINSHTGKPFEVAVGKGHPDWRPNQEDALSQAGDYEFYDYAQRKAAEKRGIGGTEGQSAAWHVERSDKAQQPGTGKGKTSRVKAPEMFNDRRKSRAKPKIGEQGTML